MLSRDVGRKGAGEPQLLALLQIVTPGSLMLALNETDLVCTPGDHVKHAAANCRLVDARYLLGERPCFLLDASDNVEYGAWRADADRIRRVRSPPLDQHGGIAGVVRPTRLPTAPTQSGDDD